jgi:hypothetical protein
VRFFRVKDLDGISVATVVRYPATGPNRVAIYECRRCHVRSARADCEHIAHVMVKTTKGVGCGESTGEDNQ